MRDTIIQGSPGLGLMVGVELGIEGKCNFEECFRNGLIINAPRAMCSGSCRH